MTDEQQDQDVEIEATEAPEAETREAPLYGVGPFTIRELALVAVWVAAFVVSFFSIFSDRRFAFLPDGSASVWTSGLEWVLTIGVPTIAVFLIVLRRFSPDGIRRVGSLGVDQFASVAFSVSAVVWLVWLWSNVGTAISTGVWVYSWVVWVEFFLMLAGVVLTVAAPFLPPFEQDFLGRPEVPAHRNARPVRAVEARPAPEPRPVDDSADSAAAAAVVEAGEPEYASYDAPTAIDESALAEPEWAPSQARGTFEPIPHERQQAFWALAPEERDVVDEAGVPIFRIGPTAWALVIEDRGEAFVVRHEDGRIGYLHDVSGVTRG
ncbi:hypothetical protein GCM10009776_09130 [Microbacterium deminutum]|uniref:Uncharacterized protein n=1 Tax=Microbacterium deminutum TaxID=344164 RepID=A0ABP5BQN5_9MICO